MKRTANAHWNGTLQEGKGEITTQSTILNKTQYSFKTRFADGVGTNPEELIAAAHAGCFAMALSFKLGGAGFTPTALNSKATIEMEHVDGGFKIANITLHIEGEVPGISEADFIKIAEDAKANCPVSQALASVPISLVAKLA